ncbi:small nuclear ribonucleoprotein Lsm8 [Histoplasma ohiense]|nr:small nuclear ribonucleoprotein Lsm8 [Histoplasma ohiense (nom. inval.)]
MFSSFLYAVSGCQLLKIYIFGWRGEKRREEKLILLILSSCEQAAARVRALLEKIGLLAKTRRRKVGKVAKNKGKFSKRKRESITRKTVEMERKNMENRK